MHPPSLSKFCDDERYHPNSVSLCLLTKNVPLLLGSLRSRTPCFVTCTTSNGPDHLDLSFPGKSFHLYLNNRTTWPSSNSRCKMCLSCHLFVFSLCNFTFSYACSRNSSRSFSCNIHFSQLDPYQSWASWLPNMPCAQAQQESEKPFHKPTCTAKRQLEFCMQCDMPIEHYLAW